ncbi:MAG: RNA polymerase sigma factor [Elusimicrobiota bacterium]
MNYKTKDEKELIKLSQAGDKNAFEVLVLRYKDRLYNIASSVCLKIPSEAQDVVQETFISAMKNITSFKYNSTFGTWLYRIAVNNCWQKFRKLKNEIRLVTEENNIKKEHINHSCVTENIIKAELSKAVISALTKLPSNYRIAIMLSDIEGLSDAESADKLKISIGALKSRLHRARKMLKEQLKNFK